MNKSTWHRIAETPMAWDTSDNEPARPGGRSPKRPPPIPIKIKDAQGRPVAQRRLPGVTEAGTGVHSSSGPSLRRRQTDRTNPPPMGTTPRPQSSMYQGTDADRQEISLQPGEKSWDVFIPGDGTYRVPAATAEEAKARALEYLADQGERRVPPGVTVLPSPIGGDSRVNIPPDPNAAPVGRRAESAVVGGSLAGYQMPHPEANEEDELSERVFRNMLEIVRKKKGGGGYVLYSPNKGKKKKPKPVGEFPTRAAAKAAELARFPPKDSKELQKSRKRVDKLKKDPKARSRAEKNDLSGRKRPRKSGAPAHARSKAKREALTRALTRGIQERLFHEDELPGSAWDERISGMHPDHVAGDRHLPDFHKRMERASIGSLGSAQKALARILRGMAKVHPGDISKDVDHGKTFMPVMLDVGGAEVGPVHLYIDGGHVKIELSGDARQQISELEPDTARKIRGGLMTYEEDHLPKIGDARKAWMDRDKHMDGVHMRLQKHIGGMSDVERHLAKQLLKGKRE